MKTRTESEIIELLLSTARDDAHIRAVILEGSRANPHAAMDPFQDYDVIFAVTKLEPYRDNFEWIKRFGELMILQIPDGMGASPILDYKVTYLMQFMDGARIDLNLFLIDRLKQKGFSEPFKVLLDEDALFDQQPPVGEEAYFPKPPSAKEFFDCCNEFWWVAPYVGKGLWRGDLGYARHWLESVLRAEAMEMLTWYFGTKTGFAANPGKCGKNFHKHIEPTILAQLNETYADADPSQTWKALESMCALFGRAGGMVATYFGYSYPSDGERRVSDYLRHIQSLPRSSNAIY